MITLATLNDATPQQIFDQVTAHLLKQNQQCKTLATSQCAYRGGEDGKLKCAAGCLIGDDEYKQEMDRAGYINNISYGSNWSSLVKRGLIPEHRHENLIINLQNIHDSCAPDDWELELKNFAINHGLVYIA
jgi:hypothetical protein